MGFLIGGNDGSRVWNGGIRNRYTQSTSGAMGGGGGGRRGGHLVFASS